jgi:hypothetical protein
VLRYCPDNEAAAEFAEEWGRLGNHLKEHGGLEQAVRRSYEGADPLVLKKSKVASLKEARVRLTEFLADAPKKPASGA